MTPHPLPRFALLAALLLVGACASRPPGDHRLPPSVGTEIEVQLRAMETAMRAEDLLRVASFYDDDAVLLSPSGRRVSGRQAIDAYWLGFGRGIDWELTTHSVEGVSDLVHHRGTSTLTYEKGGHVQTSTVEFALVWRRGTDGTLRVALDAYW